MISRRVGLYPNRAQPTFPYCDSKGNFQSLFHPMREKFKGATLFIFCPIWDLS